MKLKSICGAIGVVMLLGIGVFAIAPSNRPAVAAAADVQKTIPVLGSKNLKDVALQVASNLGDPLPTTIRYVKSSRQAAATFLDNSRVDSDDVSYVVIMQGNFTDEKAFMPPGAKAPTGNTLSLTIRASDGAVTDLVLNNQPYNDLSQLGLITDISSN
jgi:hypothetical protein